MKIRSIKAGIGLLSSVILLLTVLSGITAYCSLLSQRAEARYQQVQDLEKQLAVVILAEDKAFEGDLPPEGLTTHYELLEEQMSQVGLLLDKPLLQTRRNHFSLRMESLTKSKAEYHKVSQLLPNLVESVRYIHSHHIAYLKNLMRRGHDTQDWDSARPTERSQTIAAPELDVIASAVAVQNRLLEVFTTFYGMQRGASPAALESEFRRKIQLFYHSINTFEDGSLDAQDGLLVEELLRVGRNFESSFTGLLAEETAAEGLNAQLKSNAAVISDHFQKARQDLDENRLRMARLRDILQVTSGAAFVSLVILLAVHSRRMIKAFDRTVRETRRIESDLAYTIEADPNDYREFAVVFNALNTMARTIEEHVHQLERGREELSERVRERTAELEDANRQLQWEIQERIQAEKARADLEGKLHRAQKMEAIGTLAGGVAHDLNNILSGIVTYPDSLLLNMPEDHPLRSAIATIKSSGMRAAAIVQDLLTLARQGVTVREIVDVRQLVREYLDSPEMQRLRDLHSKVQISEEIDPDTGFVQGSPSHISKCLMNLVINALEAMPEGGTVTIGTGNVFIDTAFGAYDDVKKGEYVKLTVTDTGVGIPEADLERIFEPFFTKKRMGSSGTGLGMAVVWGSVKDHGGYVDVQSAVGEGTSISLFFPLSREARPSAPSPVTLDSIEGQGETILVVDDAPELRLVAVCILKQLGYNVEAAESGESAIEFLKTHRVDLMVLDMIMPPGIDGLETYRHAVELQPGISAIIASGYSESEQVREAQSLGAGLYVRKPYTVERLGGAVRDALRKKASG